MGTTRDDPTFSFQKIGFAVVLLLPSTWLFEKYLGLAGVFAYLVMAGMLLVWLDRSQGIAGLFDKLTERQAVWLIFLTLTLLLVAFLSIYPQADAGVVGGGSDSDDALDLAAAELIHGRYPYYPTTYLDNPISPLPGAVILALPFVVLGGSAYQNLFWVLLFAQMMKKQLRSNRRTLQGFWLLLLLAPVVSYQLLVGSDYIANAIYTLLAVDWFVPAEKAGQARFTWQMLVAAIFMGVAFCSRAHFLLLLPLVFAFLWSRVGGKQATLWMGLVVLVLLSLILPCYLYDPAGFSPLHTLGELDELDPVLPHASLVVAGLSLLLALVLAGRSGYLSLRRQTTMDIQLLFNECAAVLVFSVVWAVVLSWLLLGRLFFGFAGFGVFGLFFALAGKRWKGSSNQISVSSSTE
jgi:hypothetical protein